MSGGRDNLRNDPKQEKVPPLRFWELILIFIGLQFTIIVGIIINWWRNA